MVRPQRPDPVVGSRRRRHAAHRARPSEALRHVGDAHEVLHALPGRAEEHGGAQGCRDGGRRVEGGLGYVPLRVRRLRGGRGGGRGRRALAPGRHRGGGPVRARRGVQRAVPRGDRVRPPRLRRHVPQLPVFTRGGGHRDGGHREDRPVQRRPVAVHRLRGQHAVRR